MKLEICANSVQSALNAQEAGAHRIEICSELSLGGITPSYGVLKEISKQLQIDAFVLIRPRAGNFVYSKIEFEVMKQNISLCKELGFKGIVSGVLNADHSINLQRTKELLELSKPLSFTFHRAFDEVPNAKEALKQLIHLGVNRLLTSGQKENATQGITLLIALQQLAKNKLIIIPGSGIHSKNVLLFKEAGFQEIHTSASRPLSKLNPNSYFDAPIQTASYIPEIKEILKIIKHA
jgi:copper homeostasis protein